VPAAPPLSIVIPTCDKPASLAACLERLGPGAQTLPADRYEVIVSDDGPRQLARPLLAARFPWARWVAGPRRGPAANRNAGAAQASGEHLVFTDDDCVPAPGWLAAYARAAADPAVVALEGRTVTPPFTSAWDEAPANPSGGYFWSCNVLVRRREFLDLGGFDENYPYPAMEDIDLRQALASAGHAIGFVPDAVVEHPLRQSTLAAKLRRMSHFASHVYFGRKWRAGGLLSHWAALLWRLFRGGVVQPVRAGGRGSLSLAGVGLVALAVALVRFPSWYTRAGRLLALRRRREVPGGTAW
jgi:GT2 family glycosyltransferase